MFISSPDLGSFQPLLLQIYFLSLSLSLLLLESPYFHCVHIYFHCVPLFPKAVFTLFHSLFFCSFDIILSVLSYRSLITSSAWSSLLLKPSIVFFNSVTLFFNSRISGLFYGCYFLVKFLILSMHCLLILFSYLSVFCSSLNFLKRNILNYLCDSSQISISLGLVIGALSVSFDGVIFYLIFVIFDSLHWYLRICIIRFLFQNLQVALAETVFHQQVQFGFLGVSSGNVLRQVAPAIMVYLRASLLFELWGQGWGCAAGWG